MKEENISLQDWLENHHIKHTIRHDVLVVPGFGRCLIQDEYENIFKQDKNTGEVLFNPVENIEFLKGDDIFYIVFPFGRRWYYVDIRESGSSQQFHILRWVGEFDDEDFGLDYYPLGVHSGYELLNGSGLMKQWCEKAKWMGYKGIGICDRNTMAATLDLQTSASSADMKYIFGYSATVNMGSCKIGVKLYVKDMDGFRNLLRIQKVVAVDNEEIKEIEYITLLRYAKGNVLVFDKLCGGWLSDTVRDSCDIIDSFIRAFDGNVFFQVDTTEYKAERIDYKVLTSIKSFFDSFYISGIEYVKNIRPVIIQDMYYIDKEDWKTKVILNKVDSGAAHEQSDRQYMKSVGEIYDEFAALFSEKYSDDVFDDMIKATADIIDGASASYDLTENYAPKYDMTDEEREKYGNTLNMFHQLIEDGFRKLVPDGEEAKYRERIEYEKYIIESTDNVDYCLLTWDQLNWAQRNGILTGIGRGSAGGSLLLYLMGITYIDPLKYGLIFERFLLPERGGLAPCDVTKFKEDIDSEKYVEIELENGRVMQFDIDSQFMVKRGDEQMIVYADELEVDDDIVWDRRDELFSFPNFN